jgi:apolipoprotein D and lipocalin family protein
VVSRNQLELLRQIQNGQQRLQPFRFIGLAGGVWLDKDYQHALVCGPDRNYLWLLSRTPTISGEMKQQLLDVATRQGFDVSKLMWIEQTH